MSLKKLLSIMVVCFILVGSTFTFNGCKSMITEEQLAQLRDLRAKESSLSDMIQKKKDEKSKLERELKQRQADLKNCNDEKDFVQKKLSQWPNIWPDYTPAQPEQ